MLYVSYLLTVSATVNFENPSQRNVMPPFQLKSWTPNPFVPILRAGFATSKPIFKSKAKYKNSPLRPQGNVRRPPPPVPSSKRPVRQHQSSSEQLKSSSESPSVKQSPLEAVSLALRNVDQEHNSLLSPVFVPEDPDGVLNEKHPATSILSNSSIVVTRQLELMNIMLGFEQANKYVIMDPQGNHIGYMAEMELGMGNMMARQMFSTHRSFTTHVFDKHGKEVLRVSHDLRIWI